MDFINNDDKNYWEQVLMRMNREDDNSARRYRRYNNSLEAMGEKTVINESRQYADGECRAFDALLSFIETIDNEKLLVALKKLKPIELQIIILRFEYKMQVSEIAKALDKGVSTISERLGRIMDKLILEMR